MFRRVYGTINAQYPLRAWNPEVIGEGCVVMGKPGAPFGARERGHPYTARAAVQIHAQRRVEFTNPLPSRRKNLANRRVARENWLEPLFRPKPPAKGPAACV